MSLVCLVSPGSPVRLGGDLRKVDHLARSVARPPHGASIPDLLTLASGCLSLPSQWSRVVARGRRSRTAWHPSLNQPSSLRSSVGEARLAPFIRERIGLGAHDSEMRVPRIRTRSTQGFHSITRSIGRARRARQLLRGRGLELELYAMGGSCRPNRLLELELPHRRDHAEISSPVWRDPVRAGAITLPAGPIANRAIRLSLQRRCAPPAASRTLADGAAVFDR